uniref:Uncharacterized protein n=1 Tax=uncultured marine virus TaxID=186617 RepID=A0A0F7KZX9_9VIRU|nr:hypothetical protein [uncultured marine virus]
MGVRVSALAPIFFGLESKTWHPTSFQKSPTLRWPEPASSLPALSRPVLPDSRSPRRSTALPKRACGLSQLQPANTQ